MPIPGELIVQHEEAMIYFEVVTTAETVPERSEASRFPQNAAWRSIRATSTLSIRRENSSLPGPMAKTGT